MIPEKGHVRLPVSTLFTIGFTRRSARTFFETLRAADVVRVFDVRLRTGGQLSGFAKTPDLEYFLKTIAEIAYVPLPAFAPAAGALRQYRAREIEWPQYRRDYLDLLAWRDARREIDLALLDRGCLLCSEYAADRCHRRLAAEYLQHSFASDMRIEIVDL